MLFISDDDMVEHSSSNLSALFNITVPSVSDTGNNPDFFRCFNIFKIIFNRFVAGWIVCKINQYLKIFKLENIQSSRRKLCTRNKSPQRIGNIFNPKSVQITGKTRRQYIFNHEFGFTFHGNREIFCLADSYFPVPFFNGNKTFFINTGDASFFSKLLDVRIIFVHAENSNTAVQIIDNFHGIFIIRIENTPSVFLHAVKHHSFYTGKVFQVVNVIHPEMIFFNIG